MTKQDEHGQAGSAGDEASIEDAGRIRAAEGWFDTTLFWLAIAIAAFHIVANTLGTPLQDMLVAAANAVPATAPVLRPLGLWFGDMATLSTLTLCAVHFAGFGLLCALRYPMMRAESAGAARLVFALDIIIGLAVAASALGLAASENAIYDRGVRLNALEWAMIVTVVVGAIEFTRRTTGWIIPILIVITVTYPTVWGAEIPGVFRFAGLSFETVAFRSIYSDEGMFGLIGQISATFVFMFILFGAFLIRSGAGEFIVDLARAAAGRFTGGPGFVAVIASGLTGTISGSAIANTVSTGVITIPLMKRSGFPAKFSAGVEAASSTGGQVMPPIMGAGAFVMATYTQIPYLEIVAVALLPALVYFGSIAFFVRIEAKRSNVVASSDGERMMDVLKRGGPSFLIPITTLIGLLMWGFTPTYAAGFAILSVIGASWLTPNKMGVRAILEAMALGSRNMITTAVLLIAVGLVVNVIAMTGIGNTFSLMIADWAGGNLLVALTLIALASLVLGMGLPVTASYIVLATLSAPALQQLILANVMPSDVIDAATIADMIAGTLNDAVKPFFLLADPSSFPALAAPMPETDARALYASLPPEVLTQIYQAARGTIDPAIVLGALLSAHMAIFWLSQDSNVTPPVCLTAFAAAAIAKTPPMATGLVAWKIAKGLYLMPILFVYTNFLTGTPLEVGFIFVVALFAMAAFGAALEGYFEAPIPWYGRVGLMAGGVALIYPGSHVLNIAALVAVVGLLALNWSAAKRRPPHPAAA
ncbi:TRAP transporter fused permease subunit [Acuticoccus sp. MNP-M23]|uniref:TRAP transporter permease n=1 Tax=Acuticoccus sp. MNP-M23 TaxID=3072793 RepID=UPI002814A4F0|nr:TRAP transporter fused permease subunit [Acuticoccus sp. MNP-M23]WMS42910.1 TRAP transporter fused permease subunit [Acuticoccus sp. MNP-M23]